MNINEKTVKNTLKFKKIQICYEFKYYLFPPDLNIVVYTAHHALVINIHACYIIFIITY